MELIVGLSDALERNLLRLVFYVLDPGNRIFLLYVLTSILAAYALYRIARTAADTPAGSANADVAQGSFLGFLFPTRVWRHPSAWLDLRYFVFHQLIGHFLMLGIVGATAAIAFAWVTGSANIPEAAGLGGSLDPEEAVLFGLVSGTDLLIGTLYMFLVIGVVDFSSYWIHYLQHKWPLLWQFHKVHHSAEVMHPLSNFREHPVDNLTYKALIGLGYGLVWGITVELFGYLPALPSLLGVPLILFAFNFFAYNLRHSHIWLRWPGRWSMVFPSPAHHHVHHSRHPEHIDKNFAFVFPVWDVLFGTYHMPEDNRDVEFGVPKEDAEGLTSCWRLYVIPFRDAGRVVRRALTRHVTTGQPRPTNPLE